MDEAIPEKETERLAALESYAIMDSAPEPAYDDITELAARICECPSAIIGLFDESRHWFKSKYGLPPQIIEVPRETTICSVTFLSEDVVLVPDLTKDKRFLDHPEVVGDPYIKYYCGMPLITPEGHTLGTLCAIDFEPHEVSPEQAEVQAVALRQLSRQVMVQLELRHLLIELDNAHTELKELNQTLENKVQEQVAEIERVGRFRRFLSPQIADSILADEGGDPFKTHRREITVAFIDLRGFTNFSDSAEPEEVIDFLKCYHAEIGRMVFQYEGSIEHFAGDGVMAFFGDPIPRDDHTEMAVRMAVEMQTLGKDLCSEWREKGYDLEVGMGLAAGYATMGTIGFEGRMDYGAVGNVTILASRLSSEANGGQILTDQKTLAKVKAVVEAEPLGEMQLKGFSRPVSTFNIVRLK